MNDKIGEVYRDRKGLKRSSGYSRRSNISKRRRLNRFEMKSPQPESFNIPAKKLKLSKDCYNIEVDTAFGYRLLNFIAIFLLFQKL